MQNVECATTTVQMDSSMDRMVRKAVRSASAVTMPGSAIGRITSSDSVCRPKKAYRLSANASPMAMASRKTQRVGPEKFTTRLSQVVQGTGAADEGQVKQHDRDRDDRDGGREGQVRRVVLVDDVAQHLHLAAHDLGGDVVA